MSKDANKQLFRHYVDIWATGELARVPLVVHDDYVGHPSWGDRDREELRQRIATFREQFVNLQFTVEDQLAEGDKVASRLSATARRASDGQDVLLYGLNISRIEGGRIREEWMAWEVQPA